MAEVLTWEIYQIIPNVTSVGLRVLRCRNILHLKDELSERPGSLKAVSGFTRETD